MKIAFLDIIKIYVNTSFFLISLFLIFVVILAAMETRAEQSIMWTWHISIMLNSLIQWGLPMKSLLEIIFERITVVGTIPITRLRLSIFHIYKFTYELCCMFVLLFVVTWWYALNSVGFAMVMSSG